MTGSVTKRGENSWRLKFDLPSEDGRRKTQYATVKANGKKEAEAKLAALIASVGAGSYCEPSKVSVADFVASRIAQWSASGKLSPRSAARYQEILRNQIVPHLGDKPLQKLRPADIEGWHSDLQATGLSARTIGAAHRVLSQALNDAVRHEMLVKNVVKIQPTPKVDDKEVVIVRDIPALIEKLKGSRVHTLAMVSLFTGMRMGEILALRWSAVDLDRAVIEVRESIENTAAGTRFKPPKTKAGRRSITLPDILIGVLREHRREQLELRMRLGIGRLPDDALLISDIDGNPWKQRQTSTLWQRFAAKVGMGDITFHALRHTHASQLIDAGIDIVTISKRLGHAKPDITLRVYSHLFRKDDSKAAQAINALF
jgi:integrase